MLSKIWEARALESRRRFALITHYFIDCGNIGNGVYCNSGPTGSQMEGFHYDHVKHSATVRLSEDGKHIIFGGLGSTIIPPTCEVCHQAWYWHKSYLAGRRPV